MKHLFLPYKLALIAKEKGFDEKSIAFYNSLGQFQGIEEHIEVGAKCKDVYRSLNTPNWMKEMCTAPLYQQIIDWFRKKHNLHFYIDTTPVFDQMYPSQYKFSIKVPFQPFKWTTGHYYTEKTYYGGLNKAIEEAFKLI